MCQHRAARDACIGQHKAALSAFRKDRTEMIGQTQRHEERIGDRPGTQHSSEHDVARKAGDARQSVKPPTVKMRPIISPS